MVLPLGMLNLRVLEIILKVVSASAIQYAGVDDLFKCRPSMLYPIFVNQWSGTVNDDKLLIGSVNTCVAVRPFSMYGLPYSK